MRREDLTELHYIADIRDIGSIISRGILCKNQADQFRHQSFALDSVQAARSRHDLPSGLRIHDHAVLYLWARNATLFRIVKEGRVPSNQLCVLRVHPSVIDLPGAFMSDRNAACSHVRFDLVDLVLPRLDWQRITDEFWTKHEDPIEIDRHREEMCAELLVPGMIAPSFIRGALVPNEEAESNMNRVFPKLKVRIAPRFFFAK